MYELKTKPNDLDVYGFLSSITNTRKREDSFTILEIMKKVSNEEPKMWGTSIVGFGSYSYKYKSGHKGEWFITGFSPRKQSLTLYINTGFNEYEKLLDNLGKHKTGVACLYINKLADVDLEVLEELVQKSYESINTSN